MAETKFTLAPVKEHTQSIQFAEIVETSDNPLALPVLGRAYVPKSTLAAMGWKGERIDVTFTKGAKVG